MTSPVIASGNIGYEVGTTSAAEDIVAAVAAGILTNGVTVVVGHVRPLTVVAPAGTASTAVVSVPYTSIARTIYCNITNTANSSVDGSFTFIIEYVKIA